MKDSVCYEWVIETIVVHDEFDEDGERIIDIEENDFGDKLTDYRGNDVRDAIEKRTLSKPELLWWHEYSGGQPRHTNLGLLYHLGNEVDGELERDYAYLDDGNLPSHFPGGRKIPQRFHKELAAFQKKLTSELVQWESLIEPTLLPPTFERLRTV